MMMPFSKSFTTLHFIAQQLDVLHKVNLLDKAYGKWSVLHHLYHCWMVEHGVLGYIKLKTQDPKVLVAVSLITRVKFIFFFTMLRLGVLKVNAPEVVQKFPKEMSVKDLMDKWEKTRQEADDFFLNLPENHAEKGIFKHMFIGRLNKKLTQKFIQLHLAHHLRLCKLKP